VTPAGAEGAFQPGSRGRVLRNLPGLTKKTDMDRAEFDALLKVQEEYLRLIGPKSRFTADMIRGMHRRWLGGLYAWAGEYRTVELQKGTFRWPPAFRVEQNMAAFENGLLRQHTPCPPGSVFDVARRIAEVHGDLLLIHPFRDGNGRLARWLADLMALQAGLPPPKYEFEGAGRSSKRVAYLAAVTRAYTQDYGALTEFFASAIETRLTEVR